MPERLLLDNTTVPLTVRHMKSEIRKAATDPQIKSLANSFRQSKCPEKAIFDYAYDNITYIPDEDGFQDIRTPQRALKDGVGNCVDYTVFMGALLYALDIPFRIKVVEIEKGEGFEHVYIETNKYILDPCLGQPQDGTAVIGRPAEGKFNKETFFLITNTTICLN